ncbi:DUF4270 family protein [Polluticoccus soli]|uniref:DUF4270 family protein n=1 Tax=Polluticoccus soli TaxID=3034150 RepID=UPI0023E2E13E|nr:DUF4270 family protein [Flavipsychrobacter sp. JY13-12]
MKKQLRNFAFLSLLAATMFEVGCKEDTIINANVSPTLGPIAVDSIPDTFTVYTKTVLIDTVVTSLTPSNQVVVHGLGTVNDPYFGRTNAGVYVQVLPERGNFTFSANNPTVTEAYVVLPFSGFAWGDTTDIQDYNVYRITDNLTTDETYYSNTNKNYDPTPVGSITGVNVDKLTDSVSVLGGNKAPHLRIKLTDAFKNELVSLAASSNDAAAFLSAMKGLYIASADTTKGRAIPYFMLNNSTDYRRAAIQFFYYENGNTADTKTAFFNFTTGCAHYNRVTRNYSNTLKSAFASTAQSDEVVYLQNLPGATLDIRFPTLKNLPQIVVNRAELVITQISAPGDPEADKFWAPLLLDATGVDASGNKYVPLDKQPLTDAGALAFIDGGKKTVTLPGGITVNQYSLNIPREVQRAIVNKSDALHLQLNGVQRFFGAYRLIAGGNPSQFKVSLHITYSKL